jgi:hypothetical protein
MLPLQFSNDRNERSNLLPLLSMWNNPLIQYEAAMLMKLNWQNTSHTDHPVREVDDFISCCIFTYHLAKHVHQKTQNSLHESTMNFQNFSPKNCHYETNELWRGHVMAVRYTSVEWYLFGGCNILLVTTFRTSLLLFPLFFIVITTTWWVQQHLLCLSDPKAMARAQELQEWDWEMGNGHGGATHIFVMAGLHIKWPMFYLRDWDLAFYGILQMHGVHFKQCFIFWNGFWWYTIFYKNGQFAC